MSSVSDLLVYSLDELEAIAQEKDSVRQLLDEKRRTVYKASAPCGLIAAPCHLLRSAQTLLLAYAFVAVGSHCAGEVQLKAINVGWCLGSGGNAKIETAALSRFKRGSLSSGMPM